MMSHYTTLFRSILTFLRIQLYLAGEIGVTHPKRAVVHLFSDVIRNIIWVDRTVYGPGECLDIFICKGGVEEFGQHFLYMRDIRSHLYQIDRASCRER